jgi:apolipoprotein N-acyltransferase
MAQGFAGVTPYVRFGNSLVLGLAGMILFAALLPVSRGRRKNL